MASTYINRTQSDGNSRTWTLSLWVKKTRVSDNNDDLFFSSASNGTVELNKIEFSTDTFQFSDWNGSSLDIQLKTNRLFRDTNGWYHVVLRVDTTQSTESDRVKIYINGVQETSFQTTNYPSQNHTTKVNRSGKVLSFCRGYDFGSSSARYMDCVLSHIHLCDGYSYDPTAFGSTDATTGEWKINTSPSVTYGTNGFFILKDGNSVTDQSGNSNNFTVGGGTLTKTEDNPSNVFATINPLFVNDGGETNGLSNGNTRYYSNSVQSNQWNNMAMTLGASTGKYYWEVKYTQIHSTETVYGSSEGIASDLAPTNHNLGEGSRSGYGYGWLCGNRNTTSNTRYLKTVAGTSTLTTDSNNTPVAVNDIVGVAFDADNGKLWFHKNGTYIDDLSGYVGNPSTGAYPYHTGIQTGQIYTPWSDVWQNSTGNDIRKEYNFGNGYFGTTAVSSAGTNASGNGIFEYDVPTGYTALSTKGLNL